MNTAPPSYSACIEMIDRAYGDLTNLATLAQVRRDYARLLVAAKSGLPHIVEARNQVKKALERAEQVRP